MIDHAVLKTTPALFKELITFYERTLAPLGYKKMREIPDKAAGFGETSPDFWIFANGKGLDTGHIALRANDRDAVRKFYAAAIEAGGKDNGEPGLRPAIHPNYYAAFVHDPAGNNVEAASHTPE